MKQKEKFTGIYHRLLIYHHIFYSGEKQQVLLHLQKLPLVGALENTFWKSNILIKVTSCNYYIKVFDEDHYIVNFLYQTLIKNEKMTWNDS